MSASGGGETAKAAAAQAAAFATLTPASGDAEVAADAAVVAPAAVPIPSPSSTPVSVSVAGAQDGTPAAGCENCGAPITGPYCAQCGQKHGHSVHSLWHLAREAGEDLTHADSRLWRTLVALLARPGALTKEFLDGHRVRYLPPLRLYLVVSLVFFLLEAMLGGHGPPVVDVHVTNDAVVVVDSGPQVLDADKRCDLLSGSTPGAKAPVLPLVGDVRQTVNKACRAMSRDNGAPFREAYLHALERAMFVFIPWLALVASLLYRHPRRYYGEHLLFFLHNHAFVFLIWAGEVLVAAAIPVKGVSDAVDAVLMLYILWYLYRAMRRVYGQEPLRTLAKYALLFGAYGLTGVAVLTLTAFYSALTL